MNVMTMRNGLNVLQLVPPLTDIIDAYFILNSGNCNHLITLISGIQISKICAILPNYYFTVNISYLFVLNTSRHYLYL